MLSVSEMNVAPLFDVSQNFCQPGCTGSSGGKQKNEKNSIDYGAFYKTGVAKKVKDTNPNLVDSASANKENTNNITSKSVERKPARTR